MASVFSNLLRTRSDEADAGSTRQTAVRNMRREGFIHIGVLRFVAGRAGGGGRFWDVSVRVDGRCAPFTVPQIGVVQYLPRLLLMAHSWNVRCATSVVECSLRFVRGASRVVHGLPFVV